ncbi:MAG TPA: lysylphosphatidylglycerol synthase domain-containing protein [Noviherbaspirillum sp.]|nr:lysylphosphatidylglycerol synthase domain-containing protein [Noviherbaspirillum sp.]
MKAPRAWWPHLRRALTLAFFALVAWLLIDHARAVDWGAVLASLRARPLRGLAQAAALGAASYALYCCFDLLGRYSTGHRVPTAKVMLVNFISYAFNLNLGSLVGAVAFRYRMYSLLGLDAETVTGVVAMSMLTNWIGYVLLAGVAFAFTPIMLPPQWHLGAAGLRLLGVVLLAAIALYLLLCARAHRRTWLVRGHELVLPTLPMALLQLVMSCVNWLLIAALLYLLLQQQVAFATVLNVMLVAAIAGVVAHIPASLGVLEGVFVVLLAQQMSRNDVLAAILAYRAIYYLVPLAAAVLAYLLFEAGMRNRAKTK